jgi:hypothetical protein
MPAREEADEDLFDHLALADDHLLQLFLHELPMLAELLENVAEATGLCGQRAVPIGG